MTPLQQRIELEALVTEREGMTSHDTICAAGGQEDKLHSETEYTRLAARIRALAEEPKQIDTDSDAYNRGWFESGAAHNGEITKLKEELCTSRAELAKCEAVLGRVSKREEDARAEVERLKQDNDGFRREREELWLQLSDARKETDDLRALLETAREQLPAWARPVMHEVAFATNHCSDTDTCSWQTCVKYRALAADQRRQCEET